MREPHKSVSRIPHAAETGKRVQDSLAEMVACDPTRLDPVAVIIQNHSTTGFTQQQIQHVRHNCRTSWEHLPTQSDRQGSSPISSAHGQRRQEAQTRSWQTGSNQGPPWASSTQWWPPACSPKWRPQQPAKHRSVISSPPPRDDSPLGVKGHAQKYLC